MTRDTTARAVRIARATVDDAGGILQCVSEAFEPYRTQYTPAAFNDTVMTDETVRERIETMIVLVARNDASLIVGTIGAAVRGAEGHLRGMAVAPFAQGGAVADDLLRSIESELTDAGCSYVTLDTTAPLTRAMRFYERNGYVRSGTVSDFFGMVLYEYRKLLRGTVALV